MNGLVNQYPIGLFEAQASYNKHERDALILQIANAPQELRNALGSLEAKKLDVPYRESLDGETVWTPRQVAHHLADAHINPYMRFQQALTLDAPKVNNFFEDRWLPYQEGVPLEVSLVLLGALHARWVCLLNIMTEKDFARTFVHSEMGLQRLDVTLARYAFHGRHHIDQIKNIK